MSANRPTTPAQVPLDISKKNTRAGRQAKKKTPDANTMKLDTRCMTEEKNRRNIYQFGALLCSCHPCESKEKKKKVIKALFTDNLRKESALKKKNSDSKSMPQ